MPSPDYRDTSGIPIWPTLAAGQETQVANLGRCVAGVLPISSISRPASLAASMSTAVPVTVQVRR